MEVRAFGRSSPDLRQPGICQTGLPKLDEFERVKEHTRTGRGHRAVGERRAKRLAASGWIIMIAGRQLDLVVVGIAIEERAAKALTDGGVRPDAAAIELSAALGERGKVCAAKSNMIEAERGFGRGCGAAVALQDEAMTIFIERKENRCPIVVNELGAGQLTVPVARNRQIGNANAEMCQPHPAHAPQSPNQISIMIRTLSGDVPRKRAICSRLCASRPASSADFAPVISSPAETPNISQI